MQEYYYNELCPHFDNELTNDAGSNKLSLLSDETNGISAMKLIGVSVMYLNHASNKVVANYLELTLLDKCDASSIVTHLKNISKYLSIKNYITMGTV